MDKTSRLIAIRDLILSFEIKRQEELLEKLQERGFVLTQATLSRDLKVLKIGKKPSKDGSSVYFLPSVNEAKENIKNDDDNISLTGFLSIDFSGNLAVIKTKPAYSHSIAASIDALNLYEIIGSLAGNDTVMIILREGVSKNSVRDALATYFPDFKDKL